MTPGIAIRSVDQILSAIQLGIYERKGCLLTAYFHSLFLDEQEISSGVVDPQQRTTVQHFAQFLAYFRSAGYRFTSPKEILDGLDPQQRYILITFDDGYFNNSRALPLLKQHKASALFFVSANHVNFGKAFWHDVVHRARQKTGRSIEEIYPEFSHLREMTSDAVEQCLVERLGIGALEPVGDIDRPFTPQELRDFAQHEEVFIGNHTLNHAVLTAYSESGARAEIAGAQAELERMTGQVPLAIGYPNGDHNPKIEAIARDAGLKLGFTTVPRKEYVTNLRDPQRLMTLGRFLPAPQSDEPLVKQLSYFRSDLGLHQLYRACKNSLLRKKPSSVSA